MNSQRPQPKVRLRAMEPEDLDLLYKIENDTSLWGVGATNVPYSRYALHDYIANASNDIYTDRQVRFMIENEGGEVVGMADLVNFEPRHQRAEVGIVIETAYRRQGYAIEALRQLADYAADVLHLHQLFVIINSTNTAAINLFSRLGYDRTAVIRHWLYDGQCYRDAMFMQYLLGDHVRGR